MSRLVFVFLFISSLDVFGQEYLTTNGDITFLSKAPLNEFEGKSSSLNGLIDLEKNVLDFFVDLNTLKTGIGLRDSHMRENYLETEKFPYAEFTGKILGNPEFVPGRKVQVAATGTFKIHGVEKEIEVGGSLSKLSNGQLVLEADFSILLSDYQIPIPKLVFYELAEEQKVTINAILKEKK